jgi:hypothetical protein
MCNGFVVNSSQKFKERKLDNANFYRTLCTIKVLKILHRFYVHLKTNAPSQLPSFGVIFSG